MSGILRLFFHRVTKMKKHALALILPLILQVASFAQESEENKNLPSLKKIVKMIEKKSSSIKSFTCTKVWRTPSGTRSRRLNRIRQMENQFLYVRDQFFLVNQSIGINPRSSSREMTLIATEYHPASGNPFKKLVLLNPRINLIIARSRTDTDERQTETSSIYLNFRFFSGGIAGLQSTGFMAVHLRPDLLLKYRDQIDIQSEERNGTRYYVLKLSRDIPTPARTFSMSKSFFMNRNTGRIDRVEMEVMNNKSRVGTVESWTTVQGAKIPRTVNLSLPKNEQDLSIRFRPDLSGNDQPVPSRPAWIDDPAMSQKSSSTSLEELKKRVKKKGNKADASLYRNYSNRFVEKNFRSLPRGR